MLILAQRWVTIAAAVAICGVIGVALALLLPVRYTAEVTILPPQQETSSLGSALASEVSGLNSMAALAGSSLGLKNPNDMYVAMLKSRIVEDAHREPLRTACTSTGRSISPMRAKTFENTCNG